MPGLIQGLEIARRALLAHQSAMNITGHNIANVATEGYTRRRPVLTPTVPETTPWGIVGTGVQLEAPRHAVEPTDPGAGAGPARVRCGPC